MKTDGLRKPRRETVAAIVMLEFLALVAVVSIVQTRPPQAVGLDAPASEFSSGRAMEHLSHIAARPHPTGSPENHEVRNYIYQTLESLEVEPERQTTAHERSR